MLQESILQSKNQMFHGNCNDMPELLLSSDTVNGTKHSLDFEQNTTKVLITYSNIQLGFFSQCQHT
jgi:hypothetical protein